MNEIKLEYLNRGCPESNTLILIIICTFCGFMRCNPRVFQDWRKGSIDCQVPEWPHRRRMGNPWAHHQRIGILYHRTPTKKWSSRTPKCHFLFE